MMTMRPTLMWSLALTLSAAPAMGQTFVVPHAAYPEPLYRTTAVVAHVFVDDSAWPARSLELPSNIVAPGVTRDVAAAMLRASPTFRRQCARIGSAPGLIVTVDHGQMTSSRPYAATTRIHRRGDGRLIAEVHIGSGGDREELLAHEFEHIIEQLDGVDLAALAKRPGTGVRVVPNATEFETDRAITIGRQVASEFRGAGGA